MNYMIRHDQEPPKRELNVCATVGWSLLVVLGVAGFFAAYLIARLFRVSL